MGKTNIVPFSKRIAATYLIFISSIAGFLVVADSVLSQSLRETSHNDFSIWTRIVEGDIDVNTAVIGSSRALVHYNCRLFEKLTTHTCINLGLDASGVQLQRILLNSYLANNPPPEHLVISLDAFSFLQQDEIYRPQQYAPYLSDNEIYEGLVAINSDFWKYKHVPFYDFILHRDNLAISLDTLLGREQKQRHSRDEYGYRAVSKKWDNKFEAFKEDNPDGTSSKLDPESIQAVKEMIALGQQHEAKVLLVYAPEFGEFREYFNNREEVLAQMEDIARSTKVPFWDYSDHPKLTFRKELFYNSQHLNAEGADLYTKMLAADFRSRYGL